ncbi:MAG: heme-copper oxidase subunit III [Elusimicrobia bacterium]|nr:heme-copper oxidase subunit III [Elusimicrobiota bacterium]
MEAVVDSRSREREQAPAAAVPVRLDQAEIGKLGLWLFLLSEAMLFGGFLSSYLTLRLGNAACRLGTPAWPQAGYTGGLLLAGLNTLVLIASSYTMVRSLRRAADGDREGFRRDMLATLALGGAFLGVKAFEYYAKIRHGYYPGGPLVEANPGLGIFFSFYFAMTGLHALHVIAGLLWNGLLYKASGAAAMDERFARKVLFAGLYWHFVDVVWVFLFPLLYLI